MFVVSACFEGGMPTGMGVYDTMREAMESVKMSGTRIEVLRSSHHYNEGFIYNDFYGRIAFSVVEIIKSESPHSLFRE